MNVLLRVYFLLPWVDIWKDSARHKPEGSSGGFQINDFHPACLFRKFLMA